LGQWHNTFEVTNSTARTIQEHNFCHGSCKNHAKMKQVHQGAVGLCKKKNNCCDFHSDYVYDGDFKIGRQIIHTVKYADYLVLLTKEEKVLQDMIDKLIEIGRRYGMEMNVEKQK
jgi:hypothetical protein